MSRCKEYVKNALEMEVGEVGKIRDFSNLRSITVGVIEEVFMMYGRWCGAKIRIKTESYKG